MEEDGTEGRRLWDGGDWKFMESGEYEGVNQFENQRLYPSSTKF